MQIAVISLSQYAPDPELLNLLARNGFTVNVLAPSDAVPLFAQFPACVLVGDGMMADASSAEEAFKAAVVAHHFAGKPILGVGLGAKWLVESGLVPGLEDHKVGIAYAMRQSAVQIATVSLMPDYQLNAFTAWPLAPRMLPPALFTLTPTTVNVQFVVPPGLLFELQQQGLTVFLTDAEEIAAIANKSGNILAMLPMLLSGTLGELICQSLYATLLKGEVGAPLLPLNYYPRNPM